VLVIIQIGFFIATMLVNDCFTNSHGDCTFPSLGRLSFQPLSENPLLGPSMSKWVVNTLYSVLWIWISDLGLKVINWSEIELCLMSNLGFKLINISEIELYWSEIEPCLMSNSGFKSINWSETELFLMCSLGFEAIN
jgi:hypothetical protein